MAKEEYKDTAGQPPANTVGVFERTGGIMETYAIGQELFWAKLETVEMHIQCPDCFGKRFLTVILGDDSKVTIECSGCRSGYDQPRGYVSVHQYRHFVVTGKITGIEIKNVDGIEKV